jgi:arginyl-tRNA synthetase
MEKCRTAGVIPSDFRADPIIETPREENHGDYSTNIAFFLAPKLRKGPREIAGIIIDAMDYLQVCDRVEVAGKGFINFYVKNEIWFTALGQVYRNGVNAYMPAVGQG